MLGPSYSEGAVYYSVNGDKIAVGWLPVGVDGIRLTGHLPLEDFKAILKIIDSYEPSKDDIPMLMQKHGRIITNPQYHSVISKKIESILVKNSNTVEVNTIKPMEEGQCPQGDNIVFRKIWGKWTIKGIGLWVA